MPRTAQNKLVLRVGVHAGKPTFKVVAGYALELETGKLVWRSERHDLVRNMGTQLVSYHLTVQRGAAVLHCYLWGSQTHNDVSLFVEFGDKLQAHHLDDLKKITRLGTKKIRQVPASIDTDTLFAGRYQITYIEPQNFRRGDIISLRSI